MQKQGSELQRQNPTSPDTKKKLAEMLSQSTEEEAAGGAGKMRKAKTAGCAEEAPRSAGTDHVARLDTGYPRIQTGWGASEKNCGGRSKNRSAEMPVPTDDNIIGPIRWHG
jgi:hypothetical protein